MCYNQLMYKNVLKSTCAMHAFNRRYFHKRREPAVCFISTNDLKHSIILIINQFKKISFGQGDDSKKSANKNNDRNSNSPSFERLKIELTCPYRKIPVHRGGLFEVSRAATGYVPVTAALGLWSTYAT